MPLSYTCRPSGNTYNYGYSIFGSTDLYLAIQSEDDSTSYIEASQPGRKYVCTLDAPSVGLCYASTFYARFKSALGTPTMTYGTAVGSTFASTGSYTTTAGWVTASFAVTPTPAQVNDPTFGGGIENDGITNPCAPQCSWLRLDLSYDAPSGEVYAYLIGSFLGPLVAVGLQQMPRLVAHFNRMAAKADPRPSGGFGRYRLDVADSERMWLALHAHPWRVYSK